MMSYYHIIFIISVILYMLFSLPVLQDQYIYIHDCIRQALLQGMSARWKPEEQKPEGGEPIYENAALVEPEQIYENTATGSGEACDWLI